MQNKKITLDGLPIITRENLLALIDITSNGYIDNKLTKFMDKLSEENPQLYNFLDKAIESMKEPDFSESDDYLRGFMTASYLIYESLRRQSAANNLERELELK